MHVMITDTYPMHIPIPDPAQLVLWFGAEAGQGGPCPTGHPAGLANLALCLSRCVGGPVAAAGAAANLSIQGDRVPVFRQLVQLPGVQRHH